MHRRTGHLVSLVAGIALFGCFSMPQTAEEFRMAVPGALSAKYWTYEIDRSYEEAATSLAQHADECLNVSVEVSSSGHGSSSHWIDHYRPTVVVGKRRAEFHLQQHKKQAMLIKPHKEPEGGYYILVVDVSKLDGTRSKVDVYAPRMGYGHLTEAVDGWIRGTSDLCPDMAEVGF